MFPLIIPITLIQDTLPYPRFTSETGSIWHFTQLAPASGYQLYLQSPFLLTDHTVLSFAPAVPVLSSPTATKPQLLLQVTLSPTSQQKTAMRIW